jgi:adenosylcobinamide kinase / adenosylcobinamide-phosphate guanylyltransferase
MAPPAADLDGKASVSLVLGGARSGKSRFAEGLLSSHVGRRIYLATAEPGDEEMRARIRDHQARRAGRWRTIEAPLDIAAVIATARQQAILLDCLTLWLANSMAAGRDIDRATEELCAALDKIVAPVVIVSNEVGLGIVPESPLARDFRDRAGHLNQAVAARADRVFFLAAGLPLTLKDKAA